jgi:hypothetical protein
MHRRGDRMKAEAQTAEDAKAHIVAPMLTYKEARAYLLKEKPHLRHSHLRHSRLACGISVRLRRGSRYGWAFLQGGGWYHIVARTLAMGVASCTYSRQARRTSTLPGK